MKVITTNYNNKEIEWWVDNDIKFTSETIEFTSNGEEIVLGLHEIVKIIK